MPRNKAGMEMYLPVRRWRVGIDDDVELIESDLKESFFILYFKVLGPNHPAYTQTLPIQSSIIPKCTHKLAPSDAGEPSDKSPA